MSTKKRKAEPKVKILERRYMVLGRSHFAERWYGLHMPVFSQKEARKHYRHAVRQGWSKSNLRLVCNEITQRDLKL